jgi:hypothetical protein
LDAGAWRWDWAVVLVGSAVREDDDTEVVGDDCGPPSCWLLPKEEEEVEEMDERPGWPWLW